LSREDWGTANKPPKVNKYIENVNIASSTLVICGFILFGVFAIANLERTAHEGAHQTVTRPQEGARREKSTRAIALLVAMLTQAQ
jgi:hypothetical protein